MWTKRAFGYEGLHVNGYAYSPPTGNGPSGGDVMTMAAAVERWESERLPVVREIARELPDPAWNDRPLEDLGAALPAAMARGAEGFALTMRSAFDVTPGRTAFLEFCTQSFGTREGPVRGMTMLQGHANATAASGRALEALAEQAAAAPELAARLRAGHFDSLREINGAGAFADGFDAFLDEEGWRVPTWSEIHTATWAEDPAARDHRTLPRPGAPPRACRDRLRRCARADDRAGRERPR